MYRCFCRPVIVCLTVCVVSQQGKITSVRVKKMTDYFFFKILVIRVESGNTTTAVCRKYEFAQSLTAKSSLFVTFSLLFSPLSRFIYCLSFNVAHEEGNVYSSPSNKKRIG